MGLAAWLSEHSNIFMCTPKEPNYFSRDINAIRVANTLEDYQSLFTNVQSSHKIIGEASTNYLRSTVAIPHILETVDNPKFLVCLRNPIDLAISFHAELVKEGYETVQDFIKAWELQFLRKNGKFIPWHSDDPSMYQYYQNSLLGYQVERMLGYVSMNSVHFVLLDDLISNSKQVYLDVLNFLEVPYDLREEFPKFNVRQKPKYPFLPVLLNLLIRIKYSMPFGIRTKATNTLSKIYKHFYVIDQAPRNSEIFDYLFDFFADDILRLEKILKRDLSHWRGNRC